MYRAWISDLLARAGIVIDGPHPWDMRVHDERLYHRIFRERNLGLGEAYMEGWWDCPALDQFFHRLLASGVTDRVRGSVAHWLRFLPDLLLNRQTRHRSPIIARTHYDIGNDLFLSFLDSRNQYSCGWFRDTDDLEQAQVNKLELIAGKLELKNGHLLLDIGCGWGGLARHMAERHGCRVTAVNISAEQMRFARDYCAGLPVELVECDYRALHGSFDRIVSVGMFEHVGHRNHRTFMQVVHRCLRDDGIFLLHTIGGNTACIGNDPWMNRYIFPIGELPGPEQVAHAADRLFVIEDWHNLGPHYDRTLMAWYGNFRKAWPRLSAHFDTRFKRMWEYYLLSCAGAFRARCIQVWQIVMTRLGSGREQPACREGLAA